MPVQGTRPTLRGRISGIKHAFNKPSGRNDSHSTDGSASEVTVTEVTESLTSDKFTLTKFGRYGFPYHATCVCIDPVQKLLAIGTANGAIRICGKPGLECHVVHNNNAAVVQLVFLVNEGGLISACDDASVHLWNLRQAQPTLIQSLKFNREKITCLHLPFGSKWLYVGTERGNTYIVNVELFVISGYVINWNKCIPVSVKSHPGPVSDIQSNPEDQNKILLTFESGFCVLWDLKAKSAQHSYSLPQNSQYITCTCWHMEGRQFIAGHWDGTLSTWNYKTSSKPEDLTSPHGMSNKSDTSQSLCCPITKVQWLSGKQGEQSSIVVFSGGLALGNNKKGLTLMRGRSKMLMISEHVIDFACLAATPWKQDFQDPQAVVALLRNEIVVFDLSTLPAPSVPWFDMPYTFNIHESPVTCVQYYADCAADLIPCLYRFSPGLTNKKTPPTGFSRQKWPFTGGEAGEVDYEPALLLTGHADGTVKFWDVSANTLYPVHKVAVSNLIEKSISRSTSITSTASRTSQELQHDDPFAIQHICLCIRSRTLIIVTSFNFIVVYRFRSKETAGEIPRLDINFSTELAQETEENPFDAQISAVASSPESQSAPEEGPWSAAKHPLKLAVLKWPPGFQPDLFCQQLSAEPCPNITCVALSSAYGMLAFGNALGVALVDYIQKKCVNVLMNYEIGALGDMETPPQSGKLPLSPPMGPISPPVFQPVLNQVDTEKEHPKSKRTSKLFSVSEHKKLTKKSSRTLESSREKDRDGDCSRDQEDGVFFSKEIPMAGVTQSLLFTYSYTRKGANILCPSLWIGTSTGSAAVVALSIPPSGEQRLEQPVLAINTGIQLDLDSSIVSLHLLDKNGCVYPSPFEFWKDTDDSKSSLSTLPTFTIESTDRHFLVLASEKLLKVTNLPTLKKFSESKPVDDSSFIIKSDVFDIDGSSCAGCLTSNGHLLMLSLPSLNLLMDLECGLTVSDYRVFRTFTFSKGGEAVYLTSPTEIQRIALTKDKQKRYIEALGSCFSVIQPPEAPQKGFFQSMFSSSPSPLDRDELFGTKSGKVSRSIAEHVPGSGVDALRNDTDSVVGAVSRARVALTERGEKLSQLEDKTAMMNIRAGSFASAAHELADKYQKKKWWQL